MIIIEAKDVSFAFDEKQKIIDNISFQANENEFVSIIGPSGCGKSTFLFHTAAKHIGIRILKTV